MTGVMMIANYKIKILSGVELKKESAPMVTLDSSLPDGKIPNLTKVLSL